MAQFLPTDVGTTVNGFQDDFEGPKLNPDWRVVGQSAFSLGGGMLHATTVGGDPNHLLYELPGYNDTVQEVLARIRVTHFGTGDPSRMGVSAVVDPNTSQGINLLFRDEPNPGDRHIAFLETCVPGANNRYSLENAAGLGGLITREIPFDAFGYSRTVVGNRQPGNSPINILGDRREPIGGVSHKRRRHRRSDVDFI
jgi:hypothetical protein